MQIPRIVRDQIMFEQHLPLYPAGDCAHCAEPIEESHLIEFGTQRAAVILVHSGSGHEHCEGRENTCAERSTRGNTP